MIASIKHSTLASLFRIVIPTLIDVVCAALAVTTAAGQQPSPPTESRNVRSFGAVCNGVHDDTRAIQDAILASRGNPNILAKVIIPNNCLSGPLKLGSNQWVEFEQRATLRALPGSFPDENTSFLTISGQHNVTIVGNQATLVMNSTEYTNGEWRAGVYIYQSTNVHVEGLKVVGAGGDGFTIKGIPPPENIDLLNVTADRCARNGISIITGRNITIKHATIMSTSPNRRGAGTHGPWAGIDVEPNGVPGEVLDNIHIEDLSTSANAGAGLQFTLHAMPSVSIKVSNLHSSNDGWHNHGVGLHYGGILFASGGVNPPSPVKGEILIEGTTIDQANGSGVLWREWSGNQPSIVLRKTYIHNPGAQTGNMNRCGLYYNVRDTSFGSKYAPGTHLNVTVDDLVVKDDNKRLIRAVWLEGDAAHPLKASVNNVREEGNPHERVLLRPR